MFLSKIRPCLVEHLKYMFLVFKQYYTYFHTLFHLCVFQKNINNITQTLQTLLLTSSTKRYQSQMIGTLTWKVQELNLTTGY